MLRIYILSGLAAMMALGCAAPPPLAPAGDAQTSNALGSGMLAFDRGDTVSAMQSFEVALRRAELGDDSASVAQAAYNLGACEYRLGDLVDAQSHLDQARYEAVKAAQTPDEIDLLLCKIARARGDREHAAKLASGLAGSMDAAVSVDAKVMLVLLACDEGNALQARNNLAELDRTLTGRSDIKAGTLADVECARGRVARLNGDAQAAAEHFDTEALLLKEADRYSQVAAALMDAGQSYEARGQDAAAADRFYRAARSEAAAGTLDTSLLDRASSAAERAGDAALERLIQKLKPAPASAPAP
jgi:tetratricopeptide (TPR) repeat protein